MSKPVLFIPGLPGSHLLDETTGRRLFLRVPDSFEPPLLERLAGPEILNSSDGVRAGAPVAEIEVGGALGAILALFVDLKRAASLYDLLRPLYPAAGFGERCVRFGWDWRRPVWSPLTQEALARSLLDLRARHGPVVVIPHSTGGLVLRALLEDDEHPLHEEVIDAIDHVLAFGVPWAGTLRSFEILTAQRGLGGLLSPRQAQAVVARSWAAFDLLPPEPYEEMPALAIASTNGVAEPVSPLVDRRWFPSGAASEELRAAMARRADGSLAGLGQPGPGLELGGGSIPVTNAVGWGIETTLLATLSSNGEVVFERDPSVAGLDPTDDGDGTVPRRSAAWIEGPDIRTFHLPIGRGRGGVQKHITLWNNAGGRNLIRHVVGEEPLEPFVYATVDLGDSGSGGEFVRLRCAANQIDGSLLEDARARLVDPPGQEVAFDPALGGRLLLRVPRSNLRPVSNQLRRLEVEISWREGATGRRNRFGFFVAR